MESTLMVAVESANKLKIIDFNMPSTLYVAEHL